MDEGRGDNPSSPLPVNGEGAEGIGHLSLRTAPGPTYRASEESVVGDPLPAGAVSVATDAGLSAPGSVALFRVYVVLATGNERGSATQRVARPA